MRKVYGNEMLTQECHRRKVLLHSTTSRTVGCACSHHSPFLRLNERSVHHSYVVVTMVKSILKKVGGSASRSEEERKLCFGDIELYTFPVSLLRRSESGYSASPLYFSDPS